MYSGFAGLSLEKAWRSSNRSEFLGWEKLRTIFTSNQKWTYSEPEAGGDTLTAYLSDMFLANSPRSLARTADLGSITVANEYAGSNTGDKMQRNPLRSNPVRKGRR